MSKPWQFLFAFIGALLVVNMVNQMIHLTKKDRCEWVTNHSGVPECHVGPYGGPTPIDTTTGDVVL